jgi:hypothetical protein
MPGVWALTRGHGGRPAPRSPHAVAGHWEPGLNLVRSRLEACGRGLFASSTVLFDSRDKALPSRARPPAAGGAAVAFEQDPRAWFAVFEFHAAPVSVRDDARCRDVVAVGKRGGQVRGAVDGGGLTGEVAELADFDADALAVARPAVVGSRCWTTSRSSTVKCDVTQPERPSRAFFWLRLPCTSR